jgi:hypothetical protein
MVDFVRDIVGLSLCLCAVDGLVSDTEESELKKEIIKTYPNIDINQIENWIDEFFDSDLQIEEYAIAIPDYKSRLLALRIGTCAAASDGLNLKESLSLLKVCSLYGINIKEVLND